MATGRHKNMTNSFSIITAVMMTAVVMTVGYSSTTQVTVRSISAAWKVITTMNDNKPVGSSNRHGSSKTGTTIDANDGMTIYSKRTNQRTYRNCAIDIMLHMTLDQPVLDPSAIIWGNLGEGARSVSLMI